MAVKTDIFNPQKTVIANGLAGKSGLFSLSFSKGMLYNVPIK